MNIDAGAATDFFGVVLPNWFGAVGSILAAAVAAFAVVREAALRRSTRDIINLPPIDHSPDKMASPARTPPSGVSPALTLTQRGHQLVLQNTSDETLTITAFETVTEPFHVTLRQQLPVKLNPGEGFGFVAHHILGGPAIAVVEVRYSTQSVLSGTARFAI